MTVVSVIVAAYDVAPYIETALRSILGQTLADLEVIVVDDASRDGTAAIVEEMAGQDPRVRLIRHERNRGPSVARNTALDAARGCWIAIVDGDDWIAPARLERLVAHAEASGAGWIADDVWLVADERSRPFGRVMVGEPPGCHEISVARLIERDPPETLGYGLLQPLIRRDLIERHRIRYRAELDRVEDFIFNLDCAVAGARFFLLNEPLYHYRQRAGSMTRMAAIPTLRILLDGNDFAARLLAPLGLKDVEQALAARRAAILRALRYRHVVDPIKAGRLAAGLAGLGRDPLIVPSIAGGVAKAGLRRLGRIRRQASPARLLREARDALPMAVLRRLPGPRRLVGELPFRPMGADELARLGAVLVVAPHPDDESLGCGGLIATLQAQGHPVDVAVVTDGGASHPGSRAFPRDRLRSVREAEARAALAALGVGEKRVTFVGLADGAVPHPGAPGFDMAVAAFAAAVPLGRYDTVLVPWRRDPSPDHIASHAIVLAAQAGQNPRARILEYPIWALVDPRDPPRPGEVLVWRLDVRPVLGQKRQAIAAHRSQLGQLIDDDPHGFRLTPYVRALFERPFELFFERPPGQEQVPDARLDVARRVAAA